MKLFDSESKNIKFREVANRLLNSCFLIKEKQRDDFNFVIQNKREFLDFFEIIGYVVTIVEKDGVVALQNTFGNSRLQLKKYQSIVLLILRLLYVEKKNEIRESPDLIIKVENIAQKYEMLKMKDRKLDKTRLKETIPMFVKYNLLEKIDIDVTLDDCRLKLFPTILFAMPSDEIDIVYNQAEEKLKTYTLGGDNTDENSDEN